jgi:exodeoxyribonuclease-5
MFKKQLDLKIIYIGDPAQLKPVKDKDISPVFRKGEKIQLTKVERTGDNPILEESTNLRNGKDFNYQTKITPKGGVEYLADYNRMNQVIGENFSSKEFDKNKLFFRILSGTNQKAAEYNQLVRSLLFDTDEQIVVGDVLMGYNNFDVDYQTKEPVIINSGDYQVVDLKKGEKVISAGTESLTFAGYYVTLKNLMNDQDSLKNVFVADINEDVQKIYKFLKVIADYNIAGARAKAAGDMRTAASMFQSARAVEAQIAFMRSLFDSAGKVKLKKTLDYGYAHTIHKSQGGTYNRVMVLADTIDSFKDEATKQQLKYVAMSRASEMVYIATNHELKEPIVTEEAQEMASEIESEEAPISTIRDFYNSLTEEEKAKFGTEEDLMREYNEIPFPMSEKDFVDQKICKK